MLNKCPSALSPLFSSSPSSRCITAAIPSNSGRCASRNGKEGALWGRTSGWQHSIRLAAEQSPHLSAAPHARTGQLSPRTELWAARTSLSLPALFMCARSILTNEREGCSHSIRIPRYAKKDKLRLIQRTDLKNALCYLDKCNLPREPLEWAVLRSCLYLFAKINGQRTELHSYRRYLFQPTIPSDFT